MQENIENETKTEKYWSIDLKIYKKPIHFLLILLLISSPIWGWKLFGPDLIKGKDPRGGAIAFAVNTALGVENTKENYPYPDEFVNKLKMIDIPKIELNSFACVKRLDQTEREQCKFVNNKPTHTHYYEEVNGKMGKWPCSKTDRITLRECLEVTANPWSSDKEIALFANREILDKYPHLLKIIEPILVRPCDYIPTEKDCDGMKDEKYLKSKIQYRRESLRCDEKIDVENREDIHLWLGGYGIIGKPASMKLPVRRRD